MKVNNSTKPTQISIESDRKQLRQLYISNNITRLIKYIAYNVSYNLLATSFIKPMPHEKLLCKRNELAT